MVSSISFTIITTSISLVIILFSLLLETHLVSVVLWAYLHFSLHLYQLSFPCLLTSLQVSSFETWTEFLFSLHLGMWRKGPSPWLTQAYLVDVEYDRSIWKHGVPKTCQSHSLCSKIKIKESLMNTKWGSKTVKRARSAMVMLEPTTNILISKCVFKWAASS